MPLAYCRIKKRTPPRWYCRRYLLMQAGTVSSSSLPAAKVDGKLEQKAFSLGRPETRSTVRAKLGLQSASLPLVSAQARAWRPLMVGGDRDTASMSSAHMTWLPRQTGLPCQVCIILKSFPVSNNATLLLQGSVSASTII